jgi:hypothetical protein
MDDKPRRLDQVRDCVRRKVYSVRTERAYVGRIRRLILSDGIRHPADTGVPEVEALLTHLAARRAGVVATRNQGLSAFVLLYRVVLAVDLP